MYYKMTGLMFQHIGQRRLLLLFFFQVPALKAQKQAKALTVDYMVYEYKTNPISIDKPIPALAGNFLPGKGTSTKLLIRLAIIISRIL